MKKYILFVFLIVISLGCKNEPVDCETNSDDWVAVGIYKGFCGSNCLSAFKVTDGEVFEDNMNHLSDSEELTFYYDHLDCDLYEDYASFCMTFLYIS